MEIKLKEIPLSEITHEDLKNRKVYSRYSDSAITILDDRQHINIGLLIQTKFYILEEEND